MTISAACGQIKVKVDKITENVGRQIVSRGYRAVNAIRNAEIEVLTNPSPSAPGSPPGVRSGNLRGNWSGQVRGGAGGGGSVSIVAELKSNMHYAGYLENGTRKMAARPFKDEIAEQSLPEIVAIFSEPYV